MKKAALKLEKIEKIVLIFLFFTLLIAGSFQIISRLLKHPATRSEEFLRYNFVYLTMIGAVIITNEKSHFKIDVIYEKLNLRMKKILNFVNDFLIILFSFILVKYGTIYTIVGHERLSPTLRIPMSFVYIIIPVSGLLMIFHTVAKYKGEKK